MAHYEIKQIISNNTGKHGALIFIITSLLCRIDSKLIKKPIYFIFEQISNVLLPSCFKWTLVRLKMQRVVSRRVELPTRGSPLEILPISRDSISWDERRDCAALWLSSFFPAILPRGPNQYRYPRGGGSRHRCPSRGKRRIKLITL